MEPFVTPCQAPRWRPVGARIRFVDRHVGARPVRRHRLHVLLAPAVEGGLIDIDDDAAFTGHVRSPAALRPSIRGDYGGPARGPDGCARGGPKLLPRVSGGSSLARIYTQQLVRHVEAPRGCGHLGAHMRIQRGHRAGTDADVPEWRTKGRKHRVEAETRQRLKRNIRGVGVAR